MCITRLRSWSALVVSVVSLSLISGSGQTPDESQITEAHESRQIDPPMQPSQRIVAPPVIDSMRQPTVFKSVQVNVDANGMNIVGDAANEPSIAIDPTNPDRIVIGWRQFDSVQSNFREAGWAYSHDGGQTWTFPGSLREGVFGSDPVLDSDPDGNFHYYTLQQDFACKMFNSSDGGLSWQGPVSAYGDDKPWMTVDKTAGIGSGNIYCTWFRRFIRSVNGGAVFQGPFEVDGAPQWGTMTVDPDGIVYIVDSQSSFASRSTNARDPNATPVFEATGFDIGGQLGFLRQNSPNPSGILGQAWIATDHTGGPARGNVYALQSVIPPGQDPMEVMFVRSTDGGMSWTAPIRVNDDATLTWQWFGTMSVAPNGRIDAVWNDTRNFPGEYVSELYYSFSTDAGDTWSPNVALSPPFDPHVGWPQQTKIGDYYHTISDDTGVNIAYAATFNGEQDVYFLRVEPDVVQRELPESFAVLFGAQRSGTLQDLFESDNAYLVLEPRPGFTPTFPLIRFEVYGTAIVDDPALLGVTFEASTDAIPTQSLQRLSLLNFDTGTYAVVDERTATLSDSVVEVEIDTNAGRFIAPGTNAMTMRVEYFNPGNVIRPSWIVRVDQAVWTVTP